MVIQLSFSVDCENINNAGDIGYCACYSCSENEGDCDTHDECQNGLFCGSSNCPISFGNPEADCCYKPTLGSEHFCAAGIPCGENEGDCDSHDECQNGLFCGLGNCPESLGGSEVDCCYKPILGDENYCTASTACGEDEGDCDFDDECQDGLICGANSSLSTTTPLSTTITSSSTSSSATSSNFTTFDENITEIDYCVKGVREIMSPNYPNDYPNYVNKTWLFTASPSSIIILQFHTFHVR